MSRIVLGVANRVLGLQRHQARWSVESVHTKNIVSILHLLVALARHFRAPIRLPENVVVDVVIVTKREGVLTHRVIAEELTGLYDDVGMRCERDAFDTLFDHAPDKLMVVKKSLVTFVNKHLNKVTVRLSSGERWMLFYNLCFAFLSFILRFIISQHLFHFQRRASLSLSLYNVNIGNSDWSQEWSQVVQNGCLFTINIYIYDIYNIIRSIES